MYAVIDPVSVLGRGDATRLSLVAHVAPNQEASVEWSLQSEQGVTYQSGLLGLAGSEYSAWGEDDSYIFTWAAARLNLTIIEILEPPPPPPFVPPADPEPDPGLG